MWGDTLRVPGQGTELDKHLPNLYQGIRIQGMVQDRTKLCQTDIEVPGLGTKSDKKLPRLYQGPCHHQSQPCELNSVN
jgi:hypothetical protein